MARGDTTTRDRIVTYAERAHDEQGLTYKEVANKLGIDRSTLYRYRDGRSSPSKQIERRMSRGGKLTQLLQNLDGGADTPPGRSTSTDEFMERPEFAGDFASRLGSGLIADFEGVDDPIEVTVRPRKFELPDGSQEWRIGPPEGTLGEVVETKERTFVLGSSQDQRDLAGMVAPWLAEEGIINSPGAIARESGIRTVT